MRKIFDDAGMDFPVKITAGTYPAVCYGWLCVGDQYNARHGTETKMVLIWEVDTGTEYRQVVDKVYNMRLGFGSNLRNDLESWRGRRLTREETQNGFEPEVVIGSPCMLRIENRALDNGFVFNNVVSVQPLPVTLDPMTPQHPIINFDVDTDDLSIVDKLPRRYQKMIKRSEQYKIRTGMNTAPAPAEGQTAQQTEDDEDVPF